MIIISLVPMSNSELDLFVSSSESSILFVNKLIRLKLSTLLVNRSCSKWNALDNVAFFVIIRYGMLRYVTLPFFSFPFLSSLSLASFARLWCLVTNGRSRLPNAVDLTSAAQQCDSNPIPLRRSNTQRHTKQQRRTTKLHCALDGSVHFGKLWPANITAIGLVPTCFMNVKTRIVRIGVSQLASSRLTCTRTAQNCKQILMTK